MQRIREVIVHCSDTPDSMFYVDVEKIRRWHTMPKPDGNGWSDIGYHWVICRDGRVQAGRPEHTPGAHVRGHNKHSIGICWVGRDEPADIQYERLINKILGALKHYGLSPRDVKGHYEYDNGKSCPNLDMDKVREDLWREYDRLS